MLLNTSGLICFIDRRERRHADAVRLFHAAPSRLVTNYVLAEFVALADRRRLPRTIALAFVEALRRNREVETIFVDDALHDAAVRLLVGRVDKTWSLCDAVSFELMRERGVIDALTTDRHFEQAGFVRRLSGDG